MRYLIVNGDDFGAGRGINRGIVEAHRHGVLTSTSLLVDAPWSEAACYLSRGVPGLSVGLHVHLVTRELTGSECRAELDRQFRRFRELMGQLPTHLDSHQNVHRDARLLPHFLDLARQYDLPLREHSRARLLTKFYGQWGGQSHLEQIGVASLTRLLEAEVEAGVTELCCHPGYADPELRSSYSLEREAELRTLCDPSIRQVLAERRIQLVSFRDFDRLSADQPG